MRRVPQKPSVSARLAQIVQARLGRIIWWLIGPRLEIALTDRLIAFYEGLLERDQIGRPTQKIRAMPSQADDEHSSAGHEIGLGLVLPFSALRKEHRRVDG